MKAHAALLIFLFSINSSDAVDSAEMQSLLGFSVDSVTLIKSIYENKIGEQIVSTEFGRFIIQRRPMPLRERTTVVIFTRPMADETRKQFAGKIPEAFLRVYRLMIDDYVYNATPIKDTE